MLHNANAEHNADVIHAGLVNRLRVLTRGGADFRRRCSEFAQCIGPENEAIFELSEDSFLCDFAEQKGSFGGILLYICVGGYSE